MYVEGRVREKASAPRCHSASRLLVSWDSTRFRASLSSTSIQGKGKESMCRIAWDQIWKLPRRQSCLYLIGKGTEKRISRRQRKRFVKPSRCYILSVAPQTFSLQLLHKIFFFFLLRFSRFWPVLPNDFTSSQ